MTTAEALTWIDQSNEIFAIEFTKRSDGQLRMMNCRRKVTSHLRGGPAAYDAPAKGLVTVFDMHKMNYRAIPIEGIIRLKVGGVWIPVQ